MYASKSCAAIYDDFRNSPERAAHDLDTYIFTFTKIVMLSLQFSEMRPAFLKAVFQCESFDVGLIRVGESPKVRVMVLSRLIHLFCTYLTHCDMWRTKSINILVSMQSSSSRRLTCRRTVVMTGTYIEKLTVTKN